MALKLVFTSQFKKDYKKAEKRGLDMDELRNVLDLLRAEAPLEGHHRDHVHSGGYIGFRECHIRPDWLLVYAVDRGKLILMASRTGTHSDLFSE